MTTQEFHGLSVIVPIYNDEEVIFPLYERLISVASGIANEYEIIFIEDGSSDKSWEQIKRLKEKNRHVVGIRLARNFGQQNAISAGLDYSNGEIIIIMDSDLQDRPEDIPKLIDSLYHHDTSMAIAKWVVRDDSLIKRLFSKLFYKVSQRITSINHQPNLGVFRALRRSVIDELKKYQEKTSTPLGILYWIGSDYAIVELERDKRFAGSSGYTLGKMFRLALDRIFSFSMFPIKLATYVGASISSISFLVGIVLILRRVYGHVSPGWTSVIVLILFMSGINFLFLGIIGEYIGRTFLETKQRPRYVVKKVI
jgi:dolichol-phosphate mannosyltransferase